jgi:hypothetical protein
MTTDLMTPGTTELQATARPFLFERRQYIVTADGGTTVCAATSTSPVKEFTPDD